MQQVTLPEYAYIHAVNTFPVVNISDKYFGVEIYHTETDGTGVAAENAAFGQSSFKIKTVEYPVHDIGTKYVISKNNLEDIPGLLDKISMRARNNIIMLLMQRYTEQIPIKQQGWWGYEAQEHLPLFQQLLMQQQFKNQDGL